MRPKRRGPLRAANHHRKGKDVQIILGIMIGVVLAFVGLMAWGLRNIRREAPAKEKARQAALSQKKALEVARAALVAVMQRGTVDLGGARLAYRAERSVCILLSEIPPTEPSELQRPKGAAIQ